MNPFLNPFISLPFLKDMFLDVNRLSRLNQQQMKKYRDKAFKKIVKNAFDIPIYYDKYKRAGITPKDIHRIDDAHKIPIVTKNDLRNNFPDNIIPKGFNKDKGYVICTGGTTGKSVFIYIDSKTMIKGIIDTLRIMKVNNINYRKSRFVHLGNFSQSRADLVYEQKFLPYIKSFNSMKNYLNIDVNTPIFDIINKLDVFKPDAIMSYPTTFQHMAYLKRKGFGKNINPKILLTGGSILDEYTRNYVQDAFGCRLLNVYQSVEAGGTIAFECNQGTWHINSDYYHVEAIGDDDELVSPGERGHLVLTRMFGGGTLIVRYSGMDDWIRISESHKCSCGLNTPILIGGVEGRMGANIVLPNGKIFPSGAFCFIEPVLQRFKTFKVKQYQIIQKKIDEIEILLVIDEDLRNVGASIDQISKGIKEIYQEKTGPDVTINVREVDEIKNLKDARKPAPIVVPNVKLEEGFKVLDRWGDL